MSFQNWVKVSDEFKSQMDGIRKFVYSDLVPLEAKLGQSGFKGILPELNQKRQKVKENGWWLPQIPKEHGGMGLSLVEHGLVSEILGRTPIGHYTFNCQAPDSGNMELMLEHATKDQLEKYFNPVARGDIRSCFSMVEPELPGSNPTWLNTKAEKEGDEYVINGHKWFTSSADGASFAIVMAVTNPDAPKHKRASMIIVPTDNPGFKHVRNISIMGHSGSDWMSHAEVRYEDCRVPLENLLGPEGEGFALAQERLGPGRIHHCMRWIGIAERAFDMMCERAVKRQVAPNVRLADQQTIQNWMAESRAEINASRLLVLDCARKIDEVGQYAARDDVSIIKFHVANMLQRVVDRSLQVHGALGMTDDTPLAGWYSHERAARIYDGPDEVHKRSIARRIIAKYEV